MRRTFYLAAGAFAFLLPGFFSFPGFSPMARASGSSIDFRGIYAFITAPRVSSANQLFNVYSEAIQNPNIDGVTIMDRWSDLEKDGPGKFNWAPLDNWIKLAVKNNKKISIGIAGGAYSPSWLIDPRGAYKVPFVNLSWDRNPNSPMDQSACVTAKVPLPWDVIYKYQYIKMIRAFHDHLLGIRVDGYPAGAAYNALRIVKVGGLGTTSYEMRIGSTTAADLDPERCRAKDPDKSHIYDPSQVWIDAGYSNRNVVAAWKTIAEGIDKAFTAKDKILSTDIIVNYQAFPNVDNSGNPIPAAIGIDPVTTRILETGISLFGQRFSMQWDSYGLSQNLPYVQELTDVGENANVAWQLNNIAISQGGVFYTGCGNWTKCSPEQYQQILTHAIVTNHAKFIEIHPGNATDPDYALAISHARGLFSQSSN
jgi:hypothetical protein